MRKKGNKFIVNSKMIFSFLMIPGYKFYFCSFLIILMLFGSIFSLFNSYSVDSEYSDGDKLLAIGDAEDAYYERLEEVKNEYDDSEKEFSEMVITSAFTIIRLNSSSFSFEDMDKTKMREIADLMLKETEQEDGTVVFTPKDEEGVKESLSEYFKKLDPSLYDVTCQRMAEDVYDYIEAYNDLISDKNYSMCYSTGNLQASAFLNMSTDEYIAAMGPIAQADYSRNGVFASVTLAQSIIESGWGKSGLTQKSNNMFGIKCNGWDGECISYGTFEYGSNGYYDIVDKFRKYPTVEDSVNDHSLFLKNNSRYPKAGVFDATTYQEQIRAIHRAGYATAPNYASVIINMIEDYNLDEWDVSINVSSNLCFTGENNWNIRTVAPTSKDYAFTIVSSNRGQCVWYAVARTYEVALELGERGIFSDDEVENVRKKIFSVGGNGGDWVETSSGIFQTSTNIKDLEAGALISWKEPGDYGHIAFIEEVTSDSVTISEGWSRYRDSCPSNWGCVAFNLKTMSIDEFYNSYGPHYTGSYVFSGYIYPLKG